MRQERKPEAGNEKHSHAEHRVWIFDRDTCSIGCFVLRCGTKRFLTLQLLDFRSSLARIVHLPVPSENVSRHGKEISKSWRGLRLGQIGEANWTALCVARHRKRSDRGRRPFPVSPPRLASIKSAYCRVRQEKTKSNTGIYSDCTLDLCNGRVVENHRRLHHRTFRASRTSRGNPLCPHTGIALRARTNLQARNPAKSKTTLRR